MNAPRYMIERRSARAPQWVALSAATHTQETAARMVDELAQTKSAKRQGAEFRAVEAPAKVTQADVKAAAKARGMVARWSGEWNEWRVAFPLDHYAAQGLGRADALKRQEEQASYCTDNEEARDTVHAIANGRDAARAAYPEAFQ